MLWSLHRLKWRVTEINRYIPHREKITNKETKCLHEQMKGGSTNMLNSLIYAAINPAYIRYIQKWSKNIVFRVWWQSTEQKWNEMLTLENGTKSGGSFFFLFCRILYC